MNKTLLFYPLGGENTTKPLTQLSLFRAPISFIVSSYAGVENIQKNNTFVTSLFERLLETNKAIEISWSPRYILLIF